MCLILFIGAGRLSPPAVTRLTFTWFLSGFSLLVLGNVKKKKKCFQVGVRGSVCGILSAGDVIKPEEVPFPVPLVAFLTATLS